MPSWRTRAVQIDLTDVSTHEPKGAEPWFDEGRLRRLIGLYKADFGRFRGDGAPKGDQESYKWDRVATYQENWDIDADDFSSQAIAVLKPAAQGMGQLSEQRCLSQLYGCESGAPWDLKYWIIHAGAAWP